jgi:hypothetical protein
MTDPARRDERRSTSGTGPFLAAAAFGGVVMVAGLGFGIWSMGQGMLGFFELVAGAGRS